MMLVHNRIASMKHDNITIMPLHLIYISFLLLLQSFQLFVLCSEINMYKFTRILVVWNTPGRKFYVIDSMVVSPIRP